jgi:tRNA A37 threonylcarbamoyladenosine dehydratase
MRVDKGMIFTPDKKKMLTDEVEAEIKRLNETIQFKQGLGKSAMEELKNNRQKLQDILNVLFSKKGVVTPQETDDILNLIDTSKRSRLESQYYFGMKKATFYLVLFGAVAVGAYIYLKKRGQ